MDKEIREKIALKRYQLISPVLAEPARAQNEYFRKQAETEHEFPRYGLRKVRASTMKAWLRKYRKGGLIPSNQKTAPTEAGPNVSMRVCSRPLRSNVKPIPLSRYKNFMKSFGIRTCWANPPVYYPAFGGTPGGQHHSTLSVEDGFKNRTNKVLQKETRNEGGG